MQKYIALTCITLITSAVAMERMEISVEVPYKLSHQSPEITCIHTKEYLHWLEEQAHQTAINPDHSPGHSYENIKMALQHVGATLNATNDVINNAKKPNKNLISRPYSCRSFAEAFSFAGNGHPNSWDLYAAIPIAAAHALKTNLFKRILIIDEDLDQDPDSIRANYECKDPFQFIEERDCEYYESGNGSLFYPNNNPELAALFADKIITYDTIQIHNNVLLDFLQNKGSDIDLVFYSIDSAKTTKFDICERQRNMLALFHQCIPIVLIHSDKDDDGGDMNKYYCH